MKKISFVLLCVSLILGCKQSRKIPDTSGISITVSIERFDKAFFSIDTNRIEQGLYQLNQQFPYFTRDFVGNILGAGPLTDSNRTAFLATRQFLSSYFPVKDSIEQEFASVDWLEKDLQKSFRLIKYYFPNYRLPPKIVSYIGPFDAPGVAITRYTLAIGLQLFAGKNFSFYKSMQGQELYPAYISRRFEPVYITTNCMKAICDDLFPDNSSQWPLIEQMVEKGKYWFLLDQVLPETADSIKTGFTQKQLNWCFSNEGLIWNFFLQNDLFSIDPDLIKNYIGDGPNTQGMPESSPGNIGQWVGWQIVKKWESQNPNISPDQLMKTSPKKIFDEAKYKPK